ncbi:hypothetical protein Ddye_022706 [Dipteronia dyeriana]|uniref:DUF3741 domain-containing protein n=1 Tax=Dipteronia dyeriana TaxID=168575 RepID=A0AAD9TSH9_9ROSI|nr:hypothetical protein Ddye_022706 [Dipteronia dyeriana]
MKLSSSSSSSAPPPPSSSFSFDSKRAVSGCFAGILHRILCSRSLPTYPSDQITESCSNFSRDQELEETKQNDREDKAVAPGVVARLMGLESMPNKRPDSITRSLSMNSLDCCNKGSGMDQMQGEHRRVKSSTFSVSEIPAFLELEENEDFLVLNFENGSEEETKRRRKISSSRRKKPDTTTSSILPGFENPECSTPVKNNKEESESESEKVKFRKKKKNKKTMKKYVENDSSSEDSSPVSVLDFDQFITDHEVPRSELDSNLVESNSRRKLSPELGELEYYENRIRRNDSNLMISDEDTDANKSGSRDRGFCSSSSSWQRQSNYMEMWDQICKMTDEAEEEEEIIGGSKWWYLKKKHHHEEFEQICADFELQIVDQSLDELLQQLVGLIT